MDNETDWGKVFVGIVIVLFIGAVLVGMSRSDYGGGQIDCYAYDAYGCV